MSGMRKAIAKNMLASVQTSPTVTFNLGIDMTEMKRYRELITYNQYLLYHDRVKKATRP